VVGRVLVLIQLHQSIEDIAVRELAALKLLECFLEVSDDAFLAGGGSGGDQALEEAAAEGIEQQHQQGVEDRILDEGALSGLSLLRICYFFKS